MLLGDFSRPLPEKPLPFALGVLVLENEPPFKEILPSQDGHLVRKPKLAM